MPLKSTLHCLVSEQCYINKYASLENVLKMSLTSYSVYLKQPSRRKQCLMTLNVMPSE